MGTKLFGTICPCGPNWLGTICPEGPINWGTKCPGTICVWDQMCHSRDWTEISSCHLHVVGLNIDLLKKRFTTALGFTIFSVYSWFLDLACTTCDNFNDARMRCFSKKEDFKALFVMAKVPLIFLTSDKELPFLFGIGWVLLSEGKNLDLILFWSILK